jgi:hypothetical protein
VAVAWVSAFLLATAGASAGRAAGAAEARAPMPVFAYYYIWFDRSSWDRGKTDLPTLGRYSSDDEAVMRQHIRWAKQAGLSGFVVSWKNTPVLSRRLAELVQIAREADFKLAIIYEGLNYERQPLAIDQIAADLDYFAARFASDDVFQAFDKPLVVWSGTWKFSPAEVATVTASRRQQLLILASERNVRDYQRLAGLVDGDAYYWSSVNPDTFRGYEQKLSDLGQAVHATGGLWIAPAAPGFDARMVGGTQVVDRNDGATLRRQLDAATKSSPDVIGLISWNEFSENSQIEPSASFGMRYLDVLADALGAAAPTITDFDSSEPGAGDPGGPRYTLPLIGACVALMVLAQTVIIWRGWHERRASSNRPAEERNGQIRPGAPAS